MRTPGPPSSRRLAGDVSCRPRGFQALDRSQPAHRLGRRRAIPRYGEERSRRAPPGPRLSVLHRSPLRPGSAIRASNGGPAGCVRRRRRRRTNLARADGLEESSACSHSKLSGGCGAGGSGWESRLRRQPRKRCSLWAISRDSWWCSSPRSQMLGMLLLETDAKSPGSRSHFDPSFNDMQFVSSTIGLGLGNSYCSLNTELHRIRRVGGIRR